MGRRLAWTVGNERHENAHIVATIDLAPDTALGEMPAGWSCSTADHEMTCTSNAMLPPDAQLELSVVLVPTAPDARPDATLRIADEVSAERVSGDAGGRRTWWWIGGIVLGAPFSLWWLIVGRRREEDEEKTVPAA